MYPLCPCLPSASKRTLDRHWQLRQTEAGVYVKKCHFLRHVIWYAIFCIVHCHSLMKYFLKSQFALQISLTLGGKTKHLLAYFCTWCELTHFVIVYNFIIVILHKYYTKWQIWTKQKQIWPAVTMFFWDFSLEVLSTWFFDGIFWFTWSFGFFWQK